MLVPKINFVLKEYYLCFILLGFNLARFLYKLFGISAYKSAFGYFYCFMIINHLNNKVVLNTVDKRSSCHVLNSCFEFFINRCIVKDLLVHIISFIQIAQILND